MAGRCLHNAVQLSKPRRPHRKQMSSQNGGSSGFPILTILFFVLLLAFLAAAVGAAAATRRRRCGIASSLWDVIIDRLVLFRFQLRGAHLQVYRLGTALRTGDNRPPGRHRSRWGSLNYRTANHWSRGRGWCRDAILRRRRSGLYAHARPLLRQHIALLPDRWLSDLAAGGILFLQRGLFLLGRDRPARWVLLAFCLGEYMSPGTVGGLTTEDR